MPSPRPRRARPARTHPGTSADPARAAPEQLQFDLVRFKAPEGAVHFRLDLLGETIWATTTQIADLFGIPLETVAKHIAEVEAERRATGAARRQRRQGAASDRGSLAPSPPLHDLDTVLSVGYRVSSTKAAAFRKWATATLRAYVVDGYAVDEARLRENPAAANHLAARLRAIRANESNIYETVRAFFKTAASDYEAGSRSARSFTALLEEKFYFAATGETASDIVLERANHAAPDMGLQRFEGPQPSIDEAKVARNYLDRDELHIMHMLCEQFLLYIQSKALRGKSMTMQHLMRKLDDLLKVEDYPVLPGHKVLHQDRAVRHAQAEYARFIMRRRQQIGTDPG